MWSADTTDATLEKRIVRAVIEQVWTDVDDVRREIVLIVHGGPRRQVDDVDDESRGIHVSDARTARAASFIKGF